MKRPDAPSGITNDVRESYIKSVDGVLSIVRRTLLEHLQKMQSNAQALEVLGRLTRLANQFQEALNATVEVPEAKRTEIINLNNRASVQKLIEELQDPENLDVERLVTITCAVTDKRGYGSLKPILDELEIRQNKWGPIKSRPDLFPRDKAPDLKRILLRLLPEELERFSQ